MFSAWAFSGPDPQRILQVLQWFQVSCTLVSDALWTDGCELVPVARTCWPETLDQPSVVDFSVMVFYSFKKNGGVVTQKPLGRRRPQSAAVRAAGAGGEEEERGRAGGREPSAVGADGT